MYNVEDLGRDLLEEAREETAMTLTPGERFRYDKTHGVIIPNPDGKYCSGRLNCTWDESGACTGRSADAFGCHSAENPLST